MDFIRSWPHKFMSPVPATYWPQFSSYLWIDCWFMDNIITNKILRKPKKIISSTLLSFATDLVNYSLLKKRRKTFILPLYSQHPSEPVQTHFDFSFCSIIFSGFYVIYELMHWGLSRVGYLSLWSIIVLNLGCWFLKLRT